MHDTVIRDGHRSWRPSPKMSRRIGISSAKRLYWETAPTSAAGTWTIQWHYSAPPFVTCIPMELRARAYFSVANPGEVHFANFNGGGVPTDCLLTLRIKEA